MGYFLERNKFMNSQMVYKWIIPVYPVDAQIAGTELEKITEKRGSLKPSYVVEESMDENATLHKCFEWDDEKAADKYRQHQAQDLIRNIAVVKIDQVEPARPIRAFISFKKDNEFVSIVNVMNNSDLFENLIESAMKELENFRRKYATLEFLSELMSGIDKSIDKYQKYAEI